MATTTKRQPSTVRRSSKLVTAMAEEVAEPVKKRTYKKRSDSISGEEKPVKKTVIKKAVVKKAAKPKVVVEPELPFVIGAYVVPVKPENTFGEGTHMVIAREKSIPGQVVNMGMTAVTVQYLQNAHFQRMNATYSKGTLKVISEAEFNLRNKKIEAESKALIQKRVDEFQKNILNEHKSVVDRTDYVQNKNFLNSNFNYVKLGSWNSATGKLSSVGNHPGAVCCALTKTTSSILVHIPKDWANYYGYNLVDIKNWIAFLSHCEIGFKGAYLEKSTMGASFPGAITDSMPNLPNNNFYLRRDMETYNIIIPTSGTRMINYMHFILIRYLYNMQYYTIPFIAMQIKRGLGEKITFWEALLVAHMNLPYNGYYCIVANGDNTNLAIPSSNNSPKSIISKLQRNDNMNATFTYDRSAIYKVREAIHNQDFDAIEKLVENWRNW